MLDPRPYRSKGDCRAKCAGGAIDAAGLAETKSWLMDEWGSFLWVGLAPEVIEKSLEIADAFALRGSDSVHLALALQLRNDLGIDSNEFTFVTSDQELKAAAITAGLVVVDPQEQA